MINIYFRFIHNFNVLFMLVCVFATTICGNSSHIGNEREKNSRAKFADEHAGIGNFTIDRFRILGIGLELACNGG